MVYMGFIDLMSFGQKFLSASDFCLDNLAVYYWLVWYKI